MKTSSLLLLATLVTTLSCGNSDEEFKANSVLEKGEAEIEALKTPVIVNVSSHLADGEYNAGDELKVFAQFDKVVEVDGTPSLLLNLNGQTKVANYLYGSGTNRLTFSYTANVGDKTSKLSYIDSDSLDLGTSLIKDTRGANVDVTLPNLGEIGSLDLNKSIKVGLSDNFNNQKISTQWTKLDQDNFDADGNGNVSDDINLALLEQNGVLTISTRGADLYGTTRQMNGVYLNDQTGDFDYSIKVQSMTNTNTLARVGFFLTTDMTTANGGVYFCGTTGASKVVVSYSTTNNNNINYNLGAGTVAKPVWIRLKKQNKNLTCYYKYNDADPWTTHASPTRTVVDSTTYFDLGIMGSAKSTTSTMQAQIDDFKDLLN